MRTDIYNSDEEIEKELFEILEESEKSERNCLMIFNVFGDVIILRPHLWPGDHGCIPYVSTFSYLCKNLDL